jgi:hypothetical protein
MNLKREIVKAPFVFQIAPVQKRPKVSANEAERQRYDGGIDKRPERIRPAHRRQEARAIASLESSQGSESAGSAISDAGMSGTGIIVLQSRSHADLALKLILSRCIR